MSFNEDSTGFEEYDESVFDGEKYPSDWEYPEEEEEKKEPIKDFLSRILAAFVATLVAGMALVAPILIYYYLFGYGAYSRNGTP